MASRARSYEQDYDDEREAPPRRATSSQYSTRKERAEIAKRYAPAPAAKPKAPSKPKAAPKKAASSAKGRKNPLPRVTKQSGQTVLVVPLPRIRIKPVIRVARSLRRVLPAPRVGMRALAATAFFGAIAYSLMPSALHILRGMPVVGGMFSAGAISSTFSPEVQRWAGEIAGWAQQYNLDPNLMATVMQIESCGHPTVASYAGAQGLFQVMPFHFADGETMTDPDTNAMRGAGVLNECLRWANGNVRGALACYNGGPSLISKPTDSWPDQTQRYVVWGEGIYADAQANADSATLDAWLRAGGQSLCDMSANVSK